MSTAILTPKSVPTTARQRHESLAGPIIDSFDVYNGNANARTTQYNFLQGNHHPQLLLVSPYTEVEHQLDLSSVDEPNRLLALALTTLEPVTSSYATTAYTETFNWSTVFNNLRELAKAESFIFPRTEFYVVEFRSKLKEQIDNDLLFALDKNSHREATASGGLLKYWFGSPDAERRNLATCLWRSKEDAIAGGKGPWHAKARTIIRTTYETINVSGLTLVVEEGAEDWTFESFKIH